MSGNEDLIFLFMPSLVATLANKEQEKGKPLTEAEVLAIRDACHVVMSPPQAAKKVTVARGYDDIDPENVWAEWQRVRAEWHGNKDGIGLLDDVRRMPHLRVSNACRPEASVPGGRTIA